MRKWVSVLLAVVCVFGCALTACGKDEKPADGPMGFQVSEDGTLMLDGERFSGVGINYHNMFSYAFSHKWDTSLTCEKLELLKSYDVKVIRFMAAPFHGREFDYYYEAKEKYYETMDVIVKKAEEIGIGLIPSLFFTEYYCDYFDEGFRTAIVDETSKSYRHVVDYTREFVGRYKDSPAIYGWEFGNERALGASLPGDTCTTQGWWQLPANSERESRTLEEDKVLFEDLQALYTLFARTVNETDPHRRFIGTGDANLRTSAWHQMNEDSWATDNYEQHRAMYDVVNPEGINAISHHFYSPEATSTLDNPDTVVGGGYTIDGLETWDDYMEYITKIAKEMKKTWYIGETGYNMLFATQSDWDDGTITYEKYQAVIDAMCDSIVKYEAPLTIFWNYDPLSQRLPNDYQERGNGTDWSWSEQMKKGQIVLNAIKETNRRLGEKLKGAEA